MKSLSFFIAYFLIFNTLLLAQQKQGCISGNCKNGEGIYRFESGNIYEGPFVNGKQHGYGKISYQNGTVTAGFWANGIKDGPFASIDNEDRSFFCIYSNGKKHGYSNISDKGGNIVSEQEWDNGTLIKTKIKNDVAKKVTKPKKMPIVTVKNTSRKSHDKTNNSIVEIKKETQNTSTGKQKTSVLENKKQSNNHKKSLPDGYSKSDAAEYAKNFGRKFMMSDAWIGNFQNYTMNIHSIDVLSLNSQIYAVELTVGWNEVDGFTNLQYQYKGALIFDQYGCDPIFLISEKEEPSLFGAGSRSYQMTEKHKEAFGPYFPGVNCFRALTDGCLEKN